MIINKIEIVRMDGMKIKINSESETFEEASRRVHDAVVAYCLGYGLGVRSVTAKLAEGKNQKCGNCRFWDKVGLLPTSFTKPRQAKARCINQELSYYTQWKLESEGKNCTGYEEKI